MGGCPWGEYAPEVIKASIEHNSPRPTRLDDTMSFDEANAVRSEFALSCVSCRDDCHIDTLTMDVKLTRMDATSQTRRLIG